MESTVLSLRIDGELLERLRGHAARRGMSVQDYVARTLIREDFDERFKTAVEETEKFYGASDAPPGPVSRDQVRPSAGIA
ncbi:ribbon-helix-helix protein, CopG family [Streptomyces sp. NPDC004327]|uniref:ribbon-helix-helix protein, CopG family n=1 Tax=Streptomyces sp. NPDC004327 TaxID=3364699 RepID=UPI00368FBC97